MAGHSSVYNFLVVLTTGLGSFTYGFSSSIIGSIFGLPAFFSYFGLTLTGADSAPIIGSANGLFAGGGLIGCIFVAWFSDKLGRVTAIQYTCIVAVASAALQAASVHIGMFLAGRFLNGLACGMINATIPVYQAEISPPESRGRLVSTHGIFLVTGYSLAGWSGFGCYFEQRPEVQWRLCLALQAVSPAILCLATPWVPESPRWLIMKGKGERALKVLQRLHPPANDGLADFARSEYAQISQQLETHGESESLWKLLKIKANRKRFFMGIFVQFITQCTGILVVNNYQIMLWESVGMTGYMPLLLYAIYLSWATAMNVVSSLIVDRVGRVRLLIVGVCGLVAMLSCFTGLFSTYAGTDSKVGNAMCIVSLFLWVTFYATCIDAVSFVYCSEIFPTQMRSQGVAASVAGLFTVTLILTQVAATAFAEVGWKFYLTFIIVPAAGLPVLWQFPETKGLTLEEISALFEDEGALPDTAIASDLEKEYRIPNGTIEIVENSADARSTA